MKLNQVIAIEKGTKTRAEKTLTDVHHKLQKQDLLGGIVRTYEPKDAEGEHLPPERKMVQAHAPAQVDRALKALVDEYNVTATKEWANGSARADVVVDDVTVLSGVPVTYLLFLEKQLARLATFASKLPCLDPAYEWTYDPNKSCYVTPPVENVRTQKVQEPIVLYDATTEHPAQTQLISRDVQIGTYKTTRMSGALPASSVVETLDRISKLSKAVKLAREQANSIEVERQYPGKQVLQFLFPNASL